MFLLCIFYLDYPFTDKENPVMHNYTSSVWSVIYVIVLFISLLSFILFGVISSVGDDESTCGFTPVVFVEWKGNEIPYGEFVEKEGIDPLLHMNIHTDYSECLNGTGRPIMVYRPAP